MLELIKENLYKYKFCLVGVLIFLTIINCFFIKSVILAKILITVLYLYVVIGTCLEYKDKLIHIFFYLTFFIFTMGQYYFPQLEIGMYYDMYSMSTIQKTFLLQSLALAFIFVGSCVPVKFNAKVEQKKYSVDFKKIVRILLVVFFVIAIVSKLEIGIRVWQYGYLVIYTKTVPSRIPQIVHYLALLFPVFFFYAYMIERKKRALILYIIYLCATLLTGVRGDFAIGILLVAFMYLSNILVEKNVELTKFFSFKRIVMIGVAGILGVVFLNYYNSFRVDHTFDELNIFAEINNFFVNQGNSVNVISYACEFSNQLEDKVHMYVIGPIIENINTKLGYFGLQQDLSGFSHSLAYDVSILALGEDGVLSGGQGVGSQYIAELFIDFGYVGVILYNFCLGILLKLLNGFYKYNYFVAGTCLFVLQSLLYIPRGQAMQFVNGILSLNFMLIIVGLFVLERYEKQRSEKNV